MTDCRFTVGAHALLFMPIECTYDFAADPGAVSTIDDSVVSARCSTDWGLRVFGSYEQACWLLGVSYQYFDSTIAKTNTRPDLVSRAGTGNRTGIRRRISYQNADIRLGRYLHQCRGCQLYAFGNGRWVDLWSRRKVRTVQPNGSLITFAERSNLFGGALGVGAGAKSQICGPFHLFGEVNILGVIADRSSTDNEFMDASPQAPVYIGVGYNSDICVVPELDFRIGASYTYECGCRRFIGEVGYELDHFWNAVQYNRYAIGQPSTTQFRRCEDIGFSGLFFGLRAEF